MAGGKGTRLRPLTCDIPKPMVPILNKPVMEYSINLLKKHGIEDIAVTMAYLPSVITDYFGDGKEWGVNLNYFIEDIPLGTGGSVKNAEDFLNDTFIVISGDALTDLNIKKAIDYHNKKKSKTTIVLKKEPVPLEYGVVITNEYGRIIRFLEKPSWGEVFSDTVNTGIYILEPEVLNYYKKGQNFDFSKDLFPKLLRDEVPMYGYITEDYWNDIGDLNSYMTTHFNILDRKVDIPINAREIETGVWIEDGVKVGNNVNFNPPIYIGKNSIIKNFANIHSYSIIGPHCEIGEESTLKKSILWKNSKVGKSTNCRGTVVCNNVQLKDRINTFESSAIGKGSTLSSGVKVKPNIKIWPEKVIEEDMIVNQNLIWGTKASKTIFGYRDISGYLNTDITPEFASRLGAAYGSSLNKNSEVVVSGDCSRASDIIRKSLISGILSTGIGVIDIKDSAIPINRFAVRHYKASGGIHVRINHLENDKVHIEFIDESGANIDRGTERKIENLFNRGDFYRCNADEVKSVVEVDNFYSFYINTGEKLLENISKIKRNNPRLLISSRCKNITHLTSKFLKNIGCDVLCDYSIEKYKSINSYLNSMSKKVIRNKANFGIIFSENGENIILIDEKGRIIEEEKYTALVSLILLKIGSLKKIIMPYTTPKAIENMVREYKVDVVRTKTSPASIMREMLNFDSDKQNMMLQYILSFDGIWASGKIIDFLVNNDINLGDLIDELPNYHYIKKEIPCEWDDKGRVIKNIIIENKDNDIELFEGVKINNDKGWALIVPDSEKALFNIYAEGFSEEYANELSTIFSKKVERLLKNKRL
ncbi:sugar phosphate nucleotidyltransferase [Tepidibacter formicigenes]|jgi:mannose-1-phosphate guanylyltransferase/phosphomannomutase|uniref:Mannose-1-phosphate guanylyltransferase / phosphomannomutase n=1 Tax=Tepidibacter formicigenes DSM 15518 TaxID=1123349 RepID=A0A1M6RMT0_9FIRM|nr:sugar phosphate nucleotidyltransferase [Tepidibacter formicigenes]SHK33638.1 mannose-1-phosphate guanylyltransferase / phosphomannomutase [Tepidibacter formicigenes DSM 15518]